MNLDIIVRQTCNEHHKIDNNIVKIVLFIACNRTYYGAEGRVYELEVRRPRVDRLPLLCFLNFTAAGGQYGDIVQVSCSSRCN